MYFVQRNCKFDQLFSGALFFGDYILFQVKSFGWCHCFIISNHVNFQSSGIENPKDRNTVNDYRSGCTHTSRAPGTRVRNFPVP